MNIESQSLYDAIWRPDKKKQQQINDGEDSSIVCEKLEFFNKEHLLLLLHVLEKESQIQDNLVHFKSARHYLDSSDFDRGICRVKYRGARRYHQSHSLVLKKRNTCIGRIYGSTISKFGPFEKYVGLQRFPRWIRSLLGSLFYWDLDLYNAHSTLLTSIIIKHHPCCRGKDVISAENTFPNLFILRNERVRLIDKFSEHLQALNIANFTQPHKQLKKLFSIYLYGGNLRTWIEIEKFDEVFEDEIAAQLTEGKFTIDGLGKEMQDIAQWIWDNNNWQPLVPKDEVENWERIHGHLESEIEGQNPPQKNDEFFSNKYSRKTSFRFLSLILQDREKECLQIINQTLEEADRYMDTLIHDGGLVRKKFRNKKNNDDAGGGWRNPDPLTFGNQDTLSSFIWETEFPPEILARCEKNIFEGLGYEVQLVAKDLDLPSAMAEIQKRLSIDNTGKAVIAPPPSIPQLANHYLCKQYEELLYYYQITEGICFITDSGNYVNGEGHVMTQEQFQRSMPYKEFWQKKGKKAKFYHVYENDHVRARYSSLSFMFEDEEMNTTEEEYTEIKKKEDGDRLIYDDILDYVHKQTAKLQKRSPPTTNVKMKAGAFCDGLANIKYLFSSLTGWPILRKTQIPSSLGYDPNTKLHSWMTMFEGFATNLNVDTLFTFKPMFEMDLLENTIFKKANSSSFKVSQPLIPYLNHLYLLVGRDIELMKFVLKYFALIAQYPNRRHGGTGLIFHSKGEGTGKSVFIKLMFLLFDPFTSETHDLEADMFSRFSDCLQEKVLLHIEDVPGYQLAKFKESLKGSITADTTRIEKKNKDSYRVSNFSRYVISTNVIDKLSLQPGDRRWSIIPCSDEISKLAKSLASVPMPDLLGGVNNRLFQEFDEEQQITIIKGQSSSDDDGNVSSDPLSLNKDSFDHDVEIMGVKRRYFVLLNLFFRRSVELQVRFFEVLKYSVDVQGFHPENTCPFQLHSTTASAWHTDSPTLLDVGISTTNNNKVELSVYNSRFYGAKPGTPLERFFMGVANHLTHHKDDRNLFTKYVPKHKKDGAAACLQKNYVWISSKALLSFYNDHWLPMAFKRENSNTFAQKLAQFGDYAPKNLSKVMHIPIDCEFWVARLVRAGIDPEFCIDVTSLSKHSDSSSSLRSDGDESIMDNKQSLLLLGDEDDDLMMMNEQPHLKKKVKLNSSQPITSGEKCYSGAAAILEKKPDRDEKRSLSQKTKKKVQTFLCGITRYLACQVSLQRDLEVSCLYRCFLLWLKRGGLVALTPSQIAFETVLNAVCPSLRENRTRLHKDSQHYSFTLHNELFIYDSSLFCAYFIDIDELIKNV